MSDLTLYFFPGTCARVSLIALEHCGAPFTTRLVKFPAGEHHQPPYLAINPQGKVPALAIGDELLTENIAIVSYLAHRYPDKGIMPFGRGALADAQALSQFSWLAANVHPMVTRILIPQLFCDSAGSLARVSAMAQQMIRLHLGIADKRLASQPWLLGADWSAVDAYLFWIWDQIHLGGFDGSAFVHVAAHAKRMLAVPAVQRALAREKQAGMELAKLGFPAGPPPRPAAATAGSGAVAGGAGYTPKAADKPLTVALVGATGSAGSRVCRELLERGHAVIGLARSIDKLAPAPRLRAVQCDANDATALAAAVRGCDAIICATKAKETDTQGLIAAVRASGVKRLLVIGGAGSLTLPDGTLEMNSPKFPAFVKPESEAGARFLGQLQATRDLDWTYLSPSRFFNPGERTGRFRLGADALLMGPDGTSAISQEDYAIAMANELENPQHVRQRFTVGY